MKPATRGSWKIEPMPPATTALEYSKEFSPEEFAKISLGLVPEAMEDKWFIYLEGNVLHLHRSWTGKCVYQIEFEPEGDRHKVRRALVNRDPEQYGNPDDDYDRKLLDFLVSNLLLGRRVSFPMPAGLGKATLVTSVFQHHIEGTATPPRPHQGSHGGSSGKRTKPLKLVFTAISCRKDVYVGKFQCHDSKHHVE